jgi:hypothetical protein
MIRALQRTSIDPAEREPRATVDAKILPGERPSVGLADDDVLAQELGTHDPSRGQFVTGHHRMPIVHKNRIGDHAGTIRP